MSLTAEEVGHIAHLARLQLTAEEMARFGAQLSAILDHAASLQAVDTSKIVPTAQVISQRTIMREDEARGCLAQDEALLNAPKAARGFFVVPTVLEEHE